MNKYIDDLALFVRKPSIELNNQKRLNGNYPKISVVMPSYNQGQFIERSILSVLHQNYPNIELIIIDGESDDGTTDILEKYNEYITHRISEPDKGQIVA